MNEILLTALSFVVLLYFLQIAFIFIGTYRLRHPRTTKFPPISILVALRNEEATVQHCVESLLRLDYPEESLEIVLINDRSTDRTPEIIEELKRRSSSIKTVHIKKGLAGLSGKANAIAQGIEHCTGELILVTDGDCQVPPGWAKAHASYYTDRVGLVGGFTLLDRKGGSTPLFGKVQSLDWAYLLSIGTGAMGFGIPLSVLGNNFSFRRLAYEEVGGYRNMGFTIIEDFALMKTLLKRTRWQVLYPIDPDMLVYSYPMSTMRAFFRQRKRWSAGGKEMVSYGKFLMFLACVAHLLLPLSFFLPGSLLYAGLGLMTLIASDLALLLRTTGMVGRRDLLKYFPLWEVFYFVYTVLFAPVLLFPTTVTWKDVSYSWRFNWKLKSISHATETGSALQSLKQLFDFLNDKR